MQVHGSFNFQLLAVAEANMMNKRLSSLQGKGDSLCIALFLFSFSDWCFPGFCECFNNVVSSLLCFSVTLPYPTRDDIEAHLCVPLDLSSGGKEV